MALVENQDATVVVIGGGPAGLAAAARLAELGVSSAVVEAGMQVGGMAGSTVLWGHTVDFGPHRFFSSDAVVMDFWHRYIRGDYVLVPRQTRIYYRKRFFDYPLKAGNALRSLGFTRALAAVMSYFKARIAPRKDDGSLESWISNRFGVVLFRTFFKTYTEKLWGVSCRDLDADWAAQRIQGLTLWKAVKSALTGNRNNSLKTLVDEFAYPATGNQLLFDRLREYVEESNGTPVKLQSRVSRILFEDGRARGVALEDGTELRSEWVVSSMPITHLLNALPDVPAEVRAAGERLRFRNTILVYLLVDDEALFPDQWLYIHEPGVLHGRITNFRNWSPEIIGTDGRSVLCIEYWCFDEDAIWTAPESELVDLAARETVEIGLVKQGTVREGRVIRVPRCYPLYERGYLEPLGVVTEYLDTVPGLVPIGRYGAFKYNNQDHSLLMGIMAAESITRGEKPSLWHINTDSVYQEQAPSSALVQDADL